MNRDLRLQSVHREYLQAAYELGELKDENGVPPREILELLELTEEDGDRVLEFLVQAGMVVWPAKGVILLTEVGLEKAKELTRELEKPVIDSTQLPRLSVACRPRRLRPAPRSLRAARAGGAR